MSSSEYKLTMLIQQHQAQQARASAAADVLHPASLGTANVWAGQQLSHPPSMNDLQLSPHLQSVGLKVPDSLLQLLRQLQGLSAVAGQQSSQQPALENL
jgi:hypothetical protein